MLSRIPLVRRWLYRRHLADLRAEQQAWRADAAQHSEAVARILDQAAQHRERGGRR